jgi:hypothetical protein
VIRSTSLEFQAHVSQGVKTVILNGETLPDNLVPADKLSGDNQGKVVLA